MIRSIAACCLALAVAAPAVADVLVEFREGAPKDRFTITGLGDCPVGRSEVTIDLSGSAAGLIFDVTGSGAGVEVFQPYEQVSGQGSLLEATQVQDGDESITLTFSDLAEGVAAAFTIDVDDTAGGREITVSGSEIIGASVSVQNELGQFDAEFNADGAALVSMDGCLS